MSVTTVWQLGGIAVGGALGAVLRYLVSNGVYQWLGRDFPLGTLVVNVSGSFLMGLLSVFLLDKLSLGAEWRGIIFVGFLGAFTTFSTFSLETVFLLENEAWLKALVNSVGSVLLCVGFCWVGIWVGRLSV
jgi:fluoride exporter